VAEEGYDSLFSTTFGNSDIVAEIERAKLVSGSPHCRSLSRQFPDRHPDLLGANVKYLLFLFAWCATFLPFTVAFGQATMKSTASETQPTAVMGSVQPLRDGASSQGKGNHFGVDYSFTGQDGSAPTATLTQDGAGNLYGTASSGGASGLGIVFKLSTANQETVLHTFTGPDGATPNGRLVLDGAGNLYGTTSAGGTSRLGTVFKIDASGAETVLHSFTGNPDGASPYAGLVIDGSGVLYGTTEAGGASNLGTVFSVDSNGVEAVLHSFAGEPTDGADPKAGITLDTAGNLYGTTFTGGSYGYGTVFKLDAANSETVLYHFSDLADGANPFGGLTIDANGVLYGTTEIGGKPSGNGPIGGPFLDRPYGCCKGIVFSMGSSSFSVLYTFTGGNDGGMPTADLVLSGGVLYGATLGGGPANRGTAFSVTVATNSESVLHGFTGKADGGTPGAGLLLGSSGLFYGTTEGGGRYQHGTIFQFKK
jgi:uncharacterized repeat protein (TIGR03803 family)